MARRRNKISRKSVKPAVKQTQVSLLSQAFEAIGKEDWSQAKAILLNELNERKTPYAHYLMGCACSELKEMDEAMDHLRTALDLRSTNGHGYGWVYWEISKIYSSFYYESRDDEQATKWARLAAETGDTAHDAYGRALYSFKTDCEDEINNVIKKALQQYPTHTGVRRYLLRNTKSLEQLKSQWQDTSQAFNGEAVAVDLQYEYMLQLLPHKTYQEILQCFESMLIANSDQSFRAGIYFTMGAVCVTLGLMNEATEAFSKSQAYELPNDHYINNDINNASVVGLMATSQGNAPLLNKLCQKLVVVINKDGDFTFCGHGMMTLGLIELTYKEFYEQVECLHLFEKAAENLYELKGEISEEAISTLHFLDALIDFENEDFIGSIQSSLSIKSKELRKTIPKLYYDITCSVVESNLKKDDPDAYAKQIMEVCDVFIKQVSHEYDHETWTIGAAQFFMVGLELDREGNNHRIADLYKAFKDSHFIDEHLFKCAYAMNSMGHVEQAKTLYETYLKTEPDSCAALNNLANIYQDQGRTDEAVALYRRAIECDPKDEHAPRNLEIALQKMKCPPPKKEKSTKKTQSPDQQALRKQKAAIAQWPSLDFNKKKLLGVLHAVNHCDDLEELSNLSGMSTAWTKIHFYRLVDLGIILDGKEGFAINPEIIPLIERENSHSVAIQIFRNDTSALFKPVFNSQLEYTIYRLMIGIFPNHLVFPNMSLQSIFDYKRMKDVIDSEHFSYYLMASVDLCVISSATYLPVVGYEIDSPYHDQEKQIERDQKKNTIFKLGGIPLIRVRPHGRPSEGEIRHMLLETTRQFGQTLDPLHRQNRALDQLLVQVEQEIVEG